VDRTCIRLKPLVRPSCRLETQGSPAVALFFAVDYCAGTAVLPGDLGPPEDAFLVKQDGQNLANQAEGSFRVIDREVESYVTFAIDVSESLTQDAALLTQVITELREMLTQLERPAEQPLVSVSLLVFGRNVREYLPFTSDMGLVNQRLADILADPSAASELADGQGGTSLHEAVHKGIRSVERIQALREAVSDGGVLTTGTLVVVTDGFDASGATLDDALVADTLVNVVSIGVSNAIDDLALSRIGRDGSFLAPTPESRAQAFDEIAQRVRDYPERAYLLGYCTTATGGEHTVAVTLKGGVPPKQEATCAFDAAKFGSEACTESHFDTACDGRDCGGIAACGACADDACCAGGRCQAPGAVAPPPTPPAVGGCRGQDELCEVTGQNCERVANSSPVVYACVDPVALGDACKADARCARGEAYCLKPGSGDGVCTEVELDVGDACGDQASHSGAVCRTRNCSRERPGDPFTCRPAARAFEACDGTEANAECESGTACQEDVCTPRGVVGCKADVDCASGYCSFGVCGHAGACYFAWDDKVMR
jgi:hypothetical protein